MALAGGCERSGKFEKFAGGPPRARAGGDSDIFQSVGNSGVRPGRPEGKMAHTLLGVGHQGGESAMQRAAVGGRPAQTAEA